MALVGFILIFIGLKHNKSKVLFIISGIIFCIVAVTTCISISLNGSEAIEFFSSSKVNTYEVIDYELYNVNNKTTEFYFLKTSAGNFVIIPDDSHIITGCINYPMTIAIEEKSYVDLLSFLPKEKTIYNFFGINVDKQLEDKYNE